MCTGRVDLAFIFRSFYNGMDGVYIAGCRLDECKYITQGNYHALNTVLLGKKIMEHIGLNPERLRVEFMSSAEGSRFVETVNDFIKKVSAVGPFGKSEGLDEKGLKSKLDEVGRLVPYIKIVTRDKLSSRLKDPETWNQLFTKEEIDKLFSEIISYYIDPEKCQACMTCARRCPVEAIISAKNQVHVIEQEKCIKCGTCLEVCPTKFSAVTKISGGPVPPPLPEDKRTIVRKGKEK
jgi:coenzyme F420-reducing hydrogenase delta subunit/ferredoxin